MTLGQSAFPVRFDPPPATGPTEVQTLRAPTVETTRHYHKAFAYQADPMSPSVNLLDITATEDDTVVVVRLLVTSTQSDTLSGHSMRERVVRSHWDADALGGNGAWSGFLTHDAFDFNANGQIAISFNVAGSGPLELEIQGGTDHDRITVMLEVVANEEVAFAEFTAPT